VSTHVKRLRFVEMENAVLLKIAAFVPRIVATAREAVVTRMIPLVVKTRNSRHVFAE